MYNWQHDGQQKNLFHPNKQAECPSKCGEEETHNHYLVCQDPMMKKMRQEKLRMVRLRLTQMNTHPYLIASTIKYLDKGAETTLAEMEEHEDAISKTISDAVEENMHLSEYSFEKGFVSTKWNTAQSMWTKSTGTNNKKKQKQWGRDFIVCLQTYTYDIWKLRNDRLHGKTAKEAKEIKIEKCKQEANDNKN